MLSERRERKARHRALNRRRLVVTRLTSVPEEVRFSRALSYGLGRDAESVTAAVTLKKWSANRAE